MKDFLYIAIIAGWLGVGCSSMKAPSPPAGLPVVYHNAEYGLTFYLPVDWEGYSVLLQSWTADSYWASADVRVVNQQGSIIVLRHPQWTVKAPYQDIPIMIYTRSKWAAQEQGKFFPYAGGVIDEMWHNDKWVFGLYSRYNFEDSYKQGKEADDIIQRNCAANKMPHLYPR